MKQGVSKLVPLFMVLFLIASFLTPAKLLVPERADASSALMEWFPVITPDTEPAIVKQLYSPVIAGTAEGGSEIVKLLIGNDGTTMYAIIAQAVNNATTTSKIRFRKSINGGISWSTNNYFNLQESFTGTAAPTADTIIWDLEIAPDDPKLIAAVVSRVTALATQRVYISQDGGANWDNTLWPPAGIEVSQYVSTMDISVDFGGRVILVGTRDGAGTETDNLMTMKIPSYGGWNIQDLTGTPPSVSPFTGDVIVVEFSPTFNSDTTIAAIYANTTGTYLVTGVYDTAKNLTTWQTTGSHVEIMNPGSAAGSSPRVTEIITADMEMPSDFSGQSTSLRRFYISTDAATRSPGSTPVLPNRGVYRVDDNTIYTLMDNTTTFASQTANKANKRVASIAYWGTYASGKLLVGERLGIQCKAAVPVWFTDSPTVCPVPCWYPAKKPPSGAAGEDDCSPLYGFGNAHVVWSPTYAAQGVAYAVTGTSSYDGPYSSFTTQDDDQLGWPAGIFNIVALDESAFSLTRNNGETWNQLALIDTRMNKLTDVAPSADCTTIYLASVNNGMKCSGFDSVWRTSINEKVVAPPLPVLPIGTVWERVRVSPAATNCSNTHSNYAILRIPPDKLDGQVVGWAAGGTSSLSSIGGFPVGANTRAMAWSPDFGDYWGDITPRFAVQDFAFANSSTLYVLNLLGNIQKMPFTGTAWASSVNTVNVPTGGGHTVEATAGTWGILQDKVIVGNGTPSSTPYATAISTNGGASFIPFTRPVAAPASIGYHVLFDYSFSENNTVYAASDGSNTGVVFRQKIPEGANIDWTDIMTRFTTHVEYYGLVQTNTNNVIGQGALYAAHNALVGTTTYSGVDRSLSPLDGIPKPGVWWDCLDAATTPYRVQNPIFTLEPKSLKLCGCLTQDTNTTLYAIDNDLYSNNHNVDAGRVATLNSVGLLWEYTDCMAKKGPKATMDDGAIIGCDPATGRNQEVNFTWEQLCIANAYSLLISKDTAFSQPVWGLSATGAYLSFSPSDVTSPAFIYLAGGEGAVPAIYQTISTTGETVSLQKVATPALECGHTYYWKVRVANETTNDAVTSPWSEMRSFTIKAGFRVTTPYYGPQLLKPDNGCGCSCASPVSFSWSPFKETMEYKFELSENADMSIPLVSTTVKTTAYQYTAQLKCNKNYFWRVMAIKPAPSEWSAVFSFMTQPVPPKSEEPKPVAEEKTPPWVWALIGIGTILVIVTLILVVTTRRSY